MNIYTGFFLLGLVCLARGFATGAPDFQCEGMTPGHYGGSPQPIPGGHTITTKSVSNGGVEVTVTSPSQFKGFLLEARVDGSTDQQSVGTFKIDTTDGRFQLRDCGSGTENAVTHTDLTQTTPIDSSVTVTWSYPSNTQKVYFIATIVQDYFTYWTDVKSSTV